MFLSPKLRNSFRILELDPRAELTEKDVSKAYHSLARLSHPDKHPDDPTSTARFQAIQEANESVVAYVKSIQSQRASGIDDGGIFADATASQRERSSTERERAGFRPSNPGTYLYPRSSERQESTNSEHLYGLFAGRTYPREPGAGFRSRQTSSSPRSPQNPAYSDRPYTREFGQSYQYIPTPSRVPPSQSSAHPGFSPARGLSPGFQYPEPSARPRRPQGPAYPSRSSARDYASSYQRSQPYPRPQSPFGRQPPLRPREPQSPRYPRRPQRSRPSQNQGDTSRGTAVGRSRTDLVSPYPADSLTSDIFNLIMDCDLYWAGSSRIGDTSWIPSEIEDVLNSHYEDLFIKHRLPNEPSVSFRCLAWGVANTMLKYIRGKL